MTTWLIEPRDPLIVRDGRPFSALPGARARSLPFPFPSTIAGALRTRAGQDKSGLFDESVINDLLETSLRGPLLVEGGIEQQDLQLLVPAPADALLFDEEVEESPTGRAIIKRLVPLSETDKNLTNLPPEVDYLVGLPELDSRKPFKHAPSFWHWSQFERWLSQPDALSEPLDPPVLGYSGPAADFRIHAAIDPQTLTSRDGYLFATSGRTFLHNTNGSSAELQPSLAQTRQLFLLAELDEGLKAQLTAAAGFDSLGGERRLAYYQSAPSAIGFPECPAGLATKIATDKRCRLILLTPAMFQAGWRPSWLLKQLGVTAKLQAAIVGHPQVVSGWDYKEKQAKPTRRLAPAGSVFFLELDGQPDAIEQWVSDLWLQNVSDELGDRRDGFGLAVLGRWEQPQENKEDKDG